MPVFDFNNAPDDKKPVVCTYTTFSSNEDHASIENPILVLDNSKKEWNHHSCGISSGSSCIYSTGNGFPSCKGTVFDRYHLCILRDLTFHCH